MRAIATVVKYQCVGRTYYLRQNERTDRQPAWEADSYVPEEPCIKWVVHIGWRHLANTGEHFVFVGVRFWNACGGS